MTEIRSRGPAFVPLLVLALLICHGALGSTDRLALDPVPSVAVHQLQDVVQDVVGGPAGTLDEPPAEYPPAHEYYLVILLTVLAGAFLWLFFKGSVPARRIFAAFGQAQYNSASNVAYPETKPTPAFLQVFLQVFRL